MIQLLDHVRRVTRSDGGKTRHRDLVARMLLAHGVELGIELVDNRQQLAGVLVRHSAGHNDGVLLGVDEASNQMLWNDVDIFLQCRDIGAPRLLRQPATQRLK